jgi:undecaprenyl-diphosphatase
MDVYEAVILGIVQGITEWLPISSSGHLIIVKELVGLQQDALFDIIVHIGSLCAVLWYFREHIWKVSIGCAKGNTSSNRIALLILCAFIPTAVIGFGLSIFEEYLQNTRVVGIGLLLSAFLLYLSGRIKKSPNSRKELKLYDAIIIGIFQGLAVIPGVSRSGFTISAGKILGMKSADSARFSFMIFIPAILSALIYKIFSTVWFGAADIPYFLMFTGLVTSAIVGYITLGILMRIVNKIDYFWIYCAVLGILSLIFL